MFLFLLDYGLLGGNHPHSFWSCLLVRGPFHCNLEPTLFPQQLGPADPELRVACSFKSG